MTYECISKGDVWLLRTLSPIKGPETGEITAVTGITKSITEQKQAEDLLKAALKEKEVFVTARDTSSCKEQPSSCFEPA